MIKDIITWCIAILLLSSCSARKVDIVKNDTKITIDSTAIVKTDSISTIKNNVIVVNDSSELEISPISDTIPMIVNGITYKNAILKYKKQKNIVVDKTEKITSKNVLKQVFKKKQETKNIKNKSVYKKVSNFVYLWLLLIPVGMCIYRQLKNKIFL